MFAQMRSYKGSTWAWKSRMTESGGTATRNWQRSLHFVRGILVPDKAAVACAAIASEKRWPKANQRPTASRGRITRMSVGPVAPAAVAGPVLEDDSRKGRGGLDTAR